MNWQELLYLAGFAALWYLVVGKILPRFGIGT